MSDITFMRGYGFPRGSGMDYAGYGYAGYGGMLVNQPRRFAAETQKIPFVPEPSIFAKIPALDGLGEDFGTEYDFRIERGPPNPNALGDMVLPTLDVETGEWIQEPTAGAASSGKKVLGMLAVAAGLYYLFGR